MEPGAEFGEENADNYCYDGRRKSKFLKEMANRSDHTEFSGQSDKFIVHIKKRVRRKLSKGTVGLLFIFIR